jgi:predicted dehydrogenase
MLNTIRWGILGCGRIAGKFATDLKLVVDAELIAVGSRTQQSADVFADNHQVKYRHDSYEALAQNPEVDVIYIATPHSMHYENTMMCLRNEKAVLCEKPFAMNAHQSRRMIALAKQEGVFLMEALWTKFHPHYTKTLEIVKSGVLGDVKSMLVNFGFKPTEPVPKRLFDPALGGGTLMDIGIYNVFITLSVLGKPDEIFAYMVPSASGVDEQCAIIFKYKSGAIASLFSTFSANLATEAEICGSEGRLKLTTRFMDPGTTIELYSDVNVKEIIEVPKEPGFGFQYEARHVNYCLQNNLKESPVLSHNDTLLLMEMLDSIRTIAGIKYPTDEN